MRAWLKSLDPEARARLIADLPPETAQALVFDWSIWARDAQLPPPGDWTWWLILAGRGFGKTRTGAEYVLGRVDRGEARRIALVGPTAADVRDTMIETGPGSILKNAPPWNRPLYEPSKRRLTWPSGAMATAFSADEPERLRGPQYDTVWADELGAWKYQRETWDMIAFGFREGVPKGIITTTPRPTPVVRELLEDPSVVVTRGSTYDNAANLAKPFLRTLLARYEGTRLGLQELHAQLLTDTPGALWTLGTLEANRVRSAPALARIVVAVDPQAADPNESEDSAETGIIAAGLGLDGHGYVLRDASGRMTPAEWGEAAVKLLDDLEGDRIVAESNQGGAMVSAVIRTAAEKLHREKKRPSPHVAVTLVHASRGKLTRAEPVAALDEQGRVHHVAALAALESQMTTWVPGERSPDRMDARVWALTALMLSSPPSDTAGWAQAFQGVTVGRPPTSSRRPRDEDEDDSDFAFTRRD